MGFLSSGSLVASSGLIDLWMTFAASDLLAFRNFDLKMGAVCFS